MTSAVAGFIEFFVCSLTLKSLNFIVERNDRELLDKGKNKSKHSKEEKMPLGEHDELALV